MSVHLGKWKARTREVTLSSGMQLTIKPIDVLAKLSDTKNGGNPLLTTISKHMGQGQALDMGNMIKDDPQALPKMVTMVRELALATVIDPPLIENGHAEGISVDEISFEEKMELFGLLMGGDAIKQAATFRTGQGANLVIAPDVQAIPEPSERNGSD